jgi:hypothetical protein
MTVVQDQQNDDNDAQQPPAEPSKPPQQNDQQPQDSGTTDSADSGSDSGDSGELSIEDQLDAERKKNIQLRRQLTKSESDKKKSDADRDAIKERDELKSENDKIKGMLNSSFLVWSIGNNSKFKWQNPEDVVKFIKMDEINIDIDTGEIQGLDIALKRVAKDKPYLLIPEGPTGPQIPSGSHPVGSKPGDRITEQKRLGQKYKIPGFGSQAIRPV